MAGRETVEEELEQMSESVSTRTSRGLVVSDLHMFSRRTEIDRHMPTLHAALDDADHFVLNGDIFDFRWTVLPSHRNTIDAALRWLEDLATDYPACTMHFMAGNHDCTLEFLQELEQLVASTRNLHWYEHTLRLGDHLFLHGDAAGKGCPDALDRYRHNFRHERARPDWAHHAYELALDMRLHQVVVRMHSRRLAARRLIRYLQRVAPKDLVASKHIYFGHTHRAFSGFHHAGKQFHNTGSTVRGLEWNPMAFEVAAPVDEAV